MLQERWARVVRMLLAVAALGAVSAEVVHTAAARPVQIHITKVADPAPTPTVMPAGIDVVSDDSGATNRSERIGSSSPALTDAAGAAPKNLAALLALQEQARRNHASAGTVAVACASAIPGILLGIAFWFFVLWFWDRANVVPACVAGICSAASIFGLVVLPETADLLGQFLSPSALFAVEAASLSLLGICGLFFLYLFFPSEVTSLRLGRIELKLPAADAAERPASCGGGAGRPAPSSGFIPERPVAGLSTAKSIQTASDGEAEAPAREKRRQWNTALLLTPTPALGLAAAAALFIPVEHIDTLFLGYDLLNLPIAVGVGIFLTGVVRRKLPFARVIAATYGFMLVVLLHDVLVRTDVLWGDPAAPYAFAPFLAVIGWATVGRSVGRRKDALHRVWSRLDELEKLHAATVTEARTLESASQIQQRFVASTSHELRSPLTSILGFTELLEEELAGELSPSHRGFIQSIRESAHRLLTLVNDLLDLARVEDAGIEMHLAPVDVDDVVDDAVRHIYPLAQGKRLAVYLEKEGLGARVRADSSRLRQAVINLLSNAVKFTSEGRVVVRVRRGMPSRAGEPTVAIEIEDTGRGISAAFMPRLFDRFSREDEESYEGTGLGLAITKEFVEAMGGEITVESRVGRGSRFTITLPAAADAT